MKKHAVVFGGSGFLGSYVADELSKIGLHVTIFDAKNSRYAGSQQEMVIGDILNRDQVFDIVKGKDFVFHFAGLADLDDASTKPMETVTQNIMGTINILDAAAEADVKRVVFASSIYVYSGLGGFYRCSKQAAELYVEEYQKRHDLDFTILRYGSLYGPRADCRNGIWRFLSQGLREGRISYLGTGKEIREYVHVRDAAKLSVDILAEKYKNQHIIVTGHHPMKASDMLDMIQEILGKKLDFEYEQVKLGNHYNITPYSFNPKVGRKLVSDCYIDMGQGMLECLHEISLETEEKKD